jgi:hypothetical protein
MTVHGPTIKITNYDSSRVKVRATHSTDKPAHRYTDRCPEHGGQEVLELDDFSIEKNSVEWVPIDGEVIAYCEDCIDDERDFELRDAPDAEVVAKLIAGSRHWQEFKREHFETRDLAEGRELTYCPYCGEELATANQRTGQATCPEHGPLDLDVSQLRKQEV